ncbi:MAG: signal peptidase I [Gammaproteobacteria bacterium]|nr:signal peptidase I [Gammaproteobacteria bacterium]
MNLALILTLLTAFTGIVVAFDRFVYRSKRSAAETAVENRGLATLIDYSRSFFPVLLFVLVIRSFVFEPFRIPSGSMMPTLLQGDYIFVKKYAYGLRLPVLETKFWETGMPQRGDVVVFRLPSEPNINYIKRVIGLPGDQVSYRNHVLTINGEQVATLRDDEQPVFRSIPRFIEKLGDRPHGILIQAPLNSSRDGTFVVRDGHYFMMGDNRDNSKDSRFIGAIPETHLVGEAVRIWMHMDGFEWPDWGRIGTKIQ